MNEDRREFLKKSCSALTMAAMATQMRHFGLMSAAAQTAEKDSPSIPSDYRALVCVFMAGGNDGNNMVMPNHSSTSVSNYSNYAALRSTLGLAIPQASLLPITVPRMQNLTYGLHPSLGVGTTNNGLYELWGQGKMAVVTNVGTLVQPTTRTTYQNNTAKKPFQLFSHSDQVSQYQGGRSDTQSFTGWGGRISDLRSAIDNPAPPALVPMITSISGAQLFTSGQTTLPLAIADSNTLLNAVLNPAGFGLAPTGSTLARLNAFNALRTQDLSSTYISAASHVTDLAMQANAALQSLVTVTAPFPNTSIGRQLKQVALLIKQRGELGVNRQIFYVQLGGFDTHTGQVSQQISLFSQMAQGMRAFHDEMVAQGLANKVTQFTMADFSRTLAPAGTSASDVGTDHGWGNHMLVVGGGISASDFYGMNGANGTPFPQLSVNTADDSDNGTGARGRWVPATSVDQYAATLARWFGVPTASMSTVFPLITNFTNSNGINTDLGFMQPPAP